MNWVPLLLLLALAGGCQAADVSNVEKTIQDIKAEHEAELMAMPGVVSVGLGQDAQGSQVIVIGVKSEEVSRSLVLPRDFVNYPVEVKVLGTVRAR